MMYQKLLPSALVAAVTLAAVEAHATIPTAVTDAIDDATADVNLIGAAVIVVLVAIAVWKWSRRAL